MIYVPTKCLFIHIPRAGGSSVKKAIANVCLDNCVPFFCSHIPNGTPAFSHLQLHHPAQVWKDMMEEQEWNRIYKFAIDRDHVTRLESALDWVDQAKERPYTLDYLKHCWEPRRFYSMKREEREHYIYRNWGHHTTKWFAGEDVNIIPFEELNEKWDEIMDNCQLPRNELGKINGTK